MVHTFAAIDVGSFELTMKIFEYGGKKQMKEIDCLETGLSLGADTYATGKISKEDAIKKWQDEVIKSFPNLTAG